MNGPNPITNDAARELARARRASARLAAVQALYQMEQTGQGSLEVIRDFMDDRLGLDDEGEPVEDADPDMFKEIVKGVVKSQEKIDLAIIHRLAKGWKLERIDSISRAIIRAATYELMINISLPKQILLDEYVSIAGAFFEGPETAFVNGLLEAVARDVRPGLG